MQIDYQFYDRDGCQLNMTEWVSLFENRSYRLVKKETIGNYYIITQWVGIDFCDCTQEPIEVFETMVFNEFDPDWHRFKHKWKNDAEAREGHDDICRMIKEKIAHEDDA